jgi:hypothetical protein
LKKGELLVDGKPVVLYAKRNLATGIAFTSLDTRYKLVDMQFCDNGTSGARQDDYRHFKFPTLDIEIEMESHYRLKEILAMLFERQVIDLQGNLDEEKAVAFADEFDIEPPLPVYGGTKEQRAARKERRKNKGSSSEGNASGND